MKLGIRIKNFAPGIEPRVELPYPKLRAIAQMAEAGGLDSIWLSDHLFYRSVLRTCDPVLAGKMMALIMRACT